MRLLGAIVYEWHGEVMHAVSGPDVCITLDARWVAVGRPIGGTQLVAWEWVRSLSGWSPVDEEDR